MEVAFEISRPKQLTVKVEKHCVEFCYVLYMRVTCEREVCDVGSAEARQIKIKYSVFNPDFHISRGIISFCFCV